MDAGKTENIIMDYRYYRITERRTYVQAPFEDCDEETYNTMLTTLKSVDLSKIVELNDDTNLSGELACAGGACEIT